jgi:hypothetical protein
MELEDILCNQCADLVTHAKFEPALIHLFQHRRAGEWIPVVELYRIAGAATDEIKPEVAATWLTSPSGQPGYAVVYFCDDELQWTLTAYYNVDRLLQSATPTAAGSNPVR